MGLSVPFMLASNSTIDALISSVHTAIAVRHGIAPRKRVAPTNETATYAWGASLDFSTTGNARHFFGPGWNDPEPQNCWTDGNSAELHLPVAALEGTNLLLTAQLSPLVSPQTSAQMVRITVNGAPAGQWLVRKPMTQHLFIFERHFSGKSRLSLRFDLPRAFSPQAQGLSADPRVLAVAFHSLSLCPVNHS